MIKRKIIRGFILIGALLFLSGIISSIELIRLNRATSELLHASRGNIELSKNLLDAVQDQNTMLLTTITDSTINYRNEIAESRVRFNATLQTIKEVFEGNVELTSEILKIEKTAFDYNTIFNQVSNDTDLEWFVQVYRTTYNKLTASIKNFMIANENGIIDSASKVESNAFRASMVGIIALAGGILLVVLFYYLLNLFYIQPVMVMEHSLKRHLEKGFPFSVEVNTKDELLSLKNQIELLVARSKK